MDAKTLLDRMTDQSAQPAHIPGLDVELARLVAGIADRLTQDEVDAFVRLGVAVNRRASRLVPVVGSVG